MLVEEEAPRRHQDEEQRHPGHPAPGQRITTETGAGQWGSSLSFAGALFGIDVTVPGSGIIGVDPALGTPYTEIPDRVRHALVNQPAGHFGPLISRVISKFPSQT